MRQRGGFITTTPLTFSTSSASGVFTINDAAILRAATQWPRQPLAPTGLTAAASNAQLSLSWTAPATTYGAITNYLVEYTPSGGSAAYVLTNSTGTQYTLTGLTNGTSYSVRVAAVNFTAGDWSGTATGTPTTITILNVSSIDFSGNFGDRRAVLDSRGHAVAITDWRITATTSWGHTYSDRVLYQNQFQAPNDVALYRRDGVSSGGTTVSIYRPRTVGSIFFVVASPGVGTFTSSWRLDGYVGGGLQYSATFDQNWTWEGGD